MKLYDWKLDEISINCDTSARLASYQGQIFRDLFYQIDLDCRVCILDPGLIDFFNNDDTIITTATNINNSNIDVVVYLTCDHIWPIPSQNNLYANLHKLITLITKKKFYVVWNYFTDVTDQQIRYPIWATMCVTRHSHQLNLLDTLPKKYLYSSLSNVVRPSRIVNLLEFQQASYYNKSLITFNLPPTTELETQLNNVLSTFGITYADQFRDIAKLLPINTATSKDDVELIDEIDNAIIYDYSGAAYSDSYVNIITETGYTDRFISEKTIKPILAKQFFVIIAGNGSIAMLKDLGFDIYEDIIDHSRYDNSSDATRIQDVHRLLSEIQYYDWEQIYKDTVGRREKNRQLLLDLTFEKKFLLELRQIIETSIK